MSNHLKGLLIAFFGVLVLTPEGILVKLADSDSFTILFWRGIFFALSILIILFIGYGSRAVNEIKSIGKEGNFNWLFDWPWRRHIYSCYSLHDTS